jgi:hypothetical protein
MFRKRIGVVFIVVVVEDGLGEGAQKNSFHTRKTFRSGSPPRGGSSIGKCRENEVP